LAARHSSYLRPSSSTMENAGENHPLADVLHPNATTKDPQEPVEASKPTEPPPSPVDEPSVASPSSLRNQGALLDQDDDDDEETPRESTQDETVDKDTHKDPPAPESSRDSRSRVPLATLSRKGRPAASLPAWDGFVRQGSRIKSMLDVAVHNMLENAPVNEAAKTTEAAPAPALQVNHHQQLAQEKTAQVLQLQQVRTNRL